MTREDAKERICDMLEEATSGSEAVCYVTSYDEKALKMAIKALEQEPCEDAVSRESVRSMTCNHCGRIDCEGEADCVRMMDVQNLPPVKPAEYNTTTTPIRGKWVQLSGYCTPGGDPVWCCCKCGKGIHVYGIEHSTYGAGVADGQWVACPNCGAVMQEKS